MSKLRRCFQVEVRSPFQTVLETNKCTSWKPVAVQVPSVFITVLGRVISQLRSESHGYTVTPIQNPTTPTNAVLGGRNIAHVCTTPCHNVILMVIYFHYIYIYIPIITHTFSTRPPCFCYNCCLHRFIDVVEYTRRPRGSGLACRCRRADMLDSAVPPAGLPG